MKKGNGPYFLFWSIAITTGVVLAIAVLQRLDIVIELLGKIAGME